MPCKEPSVTFGSGTSSFDTAADSFWQYPNVMDVWQYHGQYSGELPWWYGQYNMCGFPGAAAYVVPQPKDRSTFEHMVPLLLSQLQDGAIKAEDEKRLGQLSDIWEVSSGETVPEAAYQWILKNAHEVTLFVGASDHATGAPRG